MIDAVDAHAHAARVARRARAARRALRSDQHARPGVRRSAGRRARHADRPCRIRSRARVPQVRTPLGFSAHAARRTTRRRRCSASTRAAVLRERLGVDDAAIARSRRARRHRPRRNRRATPDATHVRERRRRVTAITRKPAFWIAYALASLVALAVAWRLFPLAIPLVNLDITMSRAEAIAAARDARGAAAARARRRARAPRASRTTRRRRTTSSSKAAASAAFARARREANATRRTGGRCGCSRPARSTRRASASAPTARRTDSRAGFPKAYVRDAATQGARSPPTRARSPKTRARDDWGVDLAPYTLLEQSQQTRLGPRRPQLHLRASRAARRGAHPAACSPSPATS